MQATAGAVSWLDMYEDKLREARFFLERMREVAQERDPWPFTYYLRAFLAAVRSATAYAQKEAERRSRRPEWYALHDGDPVRVFLRALRDEDLHVRPIHAEKTATGSTHVVGVGRISVRGYKSAEGDRRFDPPVQGAIERNAARAPAGDVARASVRRITYRLPGFPGQGSDDVLELCGRYVASVEQLLGDAVAAGILAR